MLTLKRRTLFIWADRELTDAELTEIRDRYMTEGADYGRLRKAPATCLPLLAVLVGIGVWIGLGVLVWWWLG